MHYIVRLQAAFLQEAVDVLCEARKQLVLLNKFAFYIEQHEQTELFKFVQRDSEHALDELSTYLEQMLKIGDPYEVKRQVIEKAACVIFITCTNFQ